MSNRLRRKYYRVATRHGDHPKGLVVLSRDNNSNTAYVGWSLCDNQDNFTKADARRLAEQRLLVNPLIVMDCTNFNDLLQVIEFIPHSLVGDLEWLVRYEDRCIKKAAEAAAAAVAAENV